MGKPAETTVLTLELPVWAYQRLHTRAVQAGKSPQRMAQEWLIEYLKITQEEPASCRTQVQAILKASGLLGVISPALREKSMPTMTLEEIQAALARAGGPALSEIVIEQRGSTE